MTEDKRVYLNGINGATGDYLVRPLNLERAAELAKVQTLEPATLHWLKSIWHRLKQPHLGLPFYVDPTDVAQAGWCVLFHRDEAAAVKEALTPLVDHRSRQVGDDRKVKVLEYRDGETWAAWLGRHGVAPGNVVPQKVPFYVLIVGDCARIPFSFGHLLDVEYAVGRLHFDEPEGYAAYVSSLIDYETAPTVPNTREAVFFAPRHDFDRATQLSADLLVRPLVHGGLNGEHPPVAEFCRFEAREVWGDGARKEALAEILSPTGGTPPAFLFTASHGMGWPAGDSRQPGEQGALLCQDWPAVGYVNPGHYFAAADVPAEARLHGMVTFHFACYGAGTPSHDRYMYEGGEQPPPIAEKDFIAALPKRMLSHPNGGAIAAIGHVERAWGCSIKGAGADPQLTPFQNAIGRILMGQPVGFAMTDFNQRYAALSANLSDLLGRLKLRMEVPAEELAATWIERNDAEGYVVIGDPTARLRAGDIA